MEDGLEGKLRVGWGGVGYGVEWRSRVLVVRQAREGEQVAERCLGFRVLVRQARDGRHVAERGNDGGGWRRNGEDLRGFSPS